MFLSRYFVCMLALATLTGCDQVNEVLNRQQANGKAIGAACRYSGRALEDCYTRNPRVAKSDVFTGWKEMNEYMIAKKMDVVPTAPDPCVPTKKTPADQQRNASATATAD